jgi:hypothetical protein
MSDRMRLPSSYPKWAADIMTMTTIANMRAEPSVPGRPDAALLRTSSLLTLFIIIVACLSTLPFCANCNILSRLVARIVVDRAPGQKTTSNPAPEGMMKVENWSSNAGAAVSIALFI